VHLIDVLVDTSVSNIRAGLNAANQRPFQERLTAPGVKSFEHVVAEAFMPV
jgi:hypothetical protein